MLETPDQEVACADCRNQESTRSGHVAGPHQRGLASAQNVALYFADAGVHVLFDMVKLIKEVIKIRIYIYI